MRVLLNVVYAHLVAVHSQPGTEPDRDGFEDWLTSDPAAEEALAALLM